MVVTRARRRTLSNGPDTAAEPMSVTHNSEIIDEEMGEESEEVSEESEECPEKSSPKKHANISPVEGIKGSIVYHREKEMNEMTKLITYKVPFVYFTGPPSTGKRYCVKHVINNLQPTTRIVSVDMRDVLKVQGFYHSVLAQLSSTAIPDHATDFIRTLCQLGPCSIIISHSELLLDLNVLLFSTICRVNQLTNNKVCVVMVSDTPWELIHPGNGSSLSPPLIVNVSPYSRAQAIDIICQSLLTKHATLCQKAGVDDLKSYVTTCIYDSLSAYTSSLREMLTVAAALLPKYLDPVLRSQLSKSEHLKLYHQLQPHLVQSMMELSCSPALNPTLDIPYNLRVLLVCAFLASHNPARLDKRFFCKGKSSKRKARSRGGSKISEALKGPKTFPLDRLLAIHSSVAQDGTIPCSDIMSAISSLVSLNLLTRISIDLLEQPKYKCLATLKTVRTLAKESGIEFDRFYYNY